MAFEHDNAWEARPTLAAIVRGIVLVGPTALGVLSGVGLSRFVPRNSGFAAGLGWWITVLGASLLVVIATERLVRRLAPLAMLLRMTMLFPDRVPARMGLALRAARPKKLDELAEDAQRQPTAQAQAEVAVALLARLSRHHPRTRGHSERVRALTMLVADEMGIKGEDQAKLAWAALLHDLGKLEVPLDVLDKNGRPSEEEWTVLAGHPEAGRRLAEPLSEWLGPWAAAIHAHHERFDGAGYPDGLGGAAIPLAGRVVAVTDAFETMTAVRSYKKPMSIEAARTELSECADRHFDPAVVRGFLGIGVPKLWFAVGPAALLAQVPFIGAVVQAAGVPAVGLGGFAGALPASALAAGVLLAGSPLLPVNSGAGDRTPLAAEAISAEASDRSSSNDRLRDSEDVDDKDQNQSARPSRPTRRPGGSGNDGRPDTSGGGDGDGPTVPTVVDPPPVTSPPVTTPPVTSPPVTLPPVTGPGGPVPGVPLPPLPPVTVPSSPLPPVTVPSVTVPKLPSLPVVGGLSEPGELTPG